MKGTYTKPSIALNKSKRLSLTSGRPNEDTFAKIPVAGIQETCRAKENTKKTQRSSFESLQNVKYIKTNKQTGAPGWLSP